MLAASLKRSTFEKAMNVQGDEVLPTASPVRYPAEKRSIRENLMRMGMKTDERIAFGELFLKGLSIRHSRKRVQENIQRRLRWQGYHHPPGISSHGVLSQMEAEFIFELKSM